MQIRMNTPAGEDIDTFFTACGAMINSNSASINWLKLGDS
jgi:hypothetical protein